LKDPPDADLQLLLSALQRGLSEGAEALYGRLSERARAPLGDGAGTARALANELLAPLVGHREHRWEPWDRVAAAARTRVHVLGPRGEAVYLIAWRQGEDGEWRVTGLRRDDLPWG
jgi:hypothetical protein